MLLAFFLLNALNANAGVFDLALQSGAFAKIILGVLLVLSIISWALAGGKIIQIKAVHRGYFNFMNMLQQSPDPRGFHHALLASEKTAFSRLFEEGYFTFRKAFKREIAGKDTFSQNFDGPGATSQGTVQFEKEVGLRLETLANAEIVELEQSLAHLGTIVTVSPFIGLLGTVWGVLQAFLQIGAFGSAELSVVAPGIAEALITTVAGLLVAIPAAVCNNLLALRLQPVRENIERAVTELKIYFLASWRYEKANI